MSEKHQSGYERLKEKKTLESILLVAIEFERTARDFYADLAPKVSKRIRYLVEALAEEEQRHYDLFRELKESSIEDELQRELETPASDSQFSDAVHVPDLGETPDDQTILQYAMGREQAAMEQYSALAEQYEEGPIRELFAYLANEETKHKLELEKFYYELIHQSSV